MFVYEEICRLRRSKTRESGGVIYGECILRVILGKLRVAAI